MWLLVLKCIKMHKSCNILEYVKYVKMCKNYLSELNKHLLKSNVFVAYRQQKPMLYA